MADEYLTAALYGMKRFNEGARKKIKELMGMEKLIELINEHQKEKHPDGIYLPVVAYRDGVFFSDGDCLSWVIDEINLVSNNYGFIKWLVENDKIELPTSCAIDKNNDYSEREIKSDYESLLMLLSISDTPIDDLISYLK